MSCQLSAISGQHTLLAELNAESWLLMARSSPRPPPDSSTYSIPTPVPDTPLPPPGHLLPAEPRWGRPIDRALVTMDTGP